MDIVTVLAAFALGVMTGVVWVKSGKRAEAEMKRNLEGDVRDE